MRVSAVPWIVLPLCGVAVVLFATPWGIGLSPDSCAYILVARALLNGDGVAEVSLRGPQPMIHFAPLYPILVTAIGLLGIETLQAARWLQALLFGANILLSGMVIKSETRSDWAAALGSLIVLTSAAILRPHTMAWSEPAFVVFSLLAILWLSRYAELGGRTRLIAAGIAVGLAALSRYAGLALLVAGVLVVWMENRRAHRRGARDCIAFAVVSCLPSALWFLRNWMATGALTSRELVLHPIGLAQFANGASTVARLLWPLRGTAALVLATIVVGAVGLLAIFRFQPHSGESSQSGGTGAATRAALTFVIVYIAFLVVAISLFDAPTQFDDRILAPAYVWTVVGVVCGAHGWVRRRPRPAVLAGALIALVTAAFTFVQIVYTARVIRQIRRDGQGYTRREWRESEILARVRELPPDTVIFTNGTGVGVIQLLAGRRAARIPEKMLVLSARPNEQYAADLERMRTALAESGGVVVYLFSITRLEHIPAAAEIQSLLCLRTVEEVSDGAIYALPPQGGA